MRVARRLPLSAQVWSSIGLAVRLEFLYVRMTAFIRTTMKFVTTLLCDVALLEYRVHVDAATTTTAGKQRETASPSCKDERASCPPLSSAPPAARAETLVPAIITKGNAGATNASRICHIFLRVELA